MLFSSLVFLSIFLPCALIVGTAGPLRFRNIALLFASLVFYTWGGGLRVAILVGSGLVAWLAGAVTNRRQISGDSTRIVLWVVIPLLLAPLFVIKYARWFSEIAASATGRIGIDLPLAPDFGLPIGLSFFTFQAISYVIDVQQKTAVSQRRLIDFMLYLSLFPQLIAGPIVRYSSIAAELTERRITSDNVSSGLQRFSHGLAKKVVIADSVAPLSDAAFSVQDPSMLTAWVGILAFTIQIYFDFSGYSDMAIGLGRVFGFTFPENFRRPYSSVSITDFWRRWHISLSEWFRDYVYIPLGGNRAGPARVYFNLVVVFGLTALWHGAAWTFMVWGGLHALALLIERATGTNTTAVSKGPRSTLWARARTMLLVMLMWTFFRAASVSDALALIQAALWPPTGLSLDPRLAVAITSRSIPAFLIGAASIGFARSFTAPHWLAQREGGLAPLLRVAIMAAGLFASLALIATGSLSPFLYFAF